MSAARYLRIAAFLVATLVLSVRFAEHAPTRQGIAFQGDSEQLVYGPLMAAWARPDARSFGVSTFMVSPEGKPYLAQFGLQKRFLALALSPGGNFLDQLELAWIVVGVLCAAVLAWLVAFEAKRSGVVAASVLLAMVALSPWIIAFSTVLYWSSFLFYLPFVAVWTSRSGPAGAPRWLGPALLGLVAVKSLCGYEYLSGIVGGACVAAVWRDLEDGATVRDALLRAVRIGLWSVGGFAIAVSIHVAAAAAAVGGGLSEGLAAFVQPALYRTVGDVIGAPISLADDARTWLSYFDLPVVANVQQTLAILTEERLLLGVIAAGAFTWWADKGPIRRALAIGLPLALVASLSWNLLARGHMRYHLHINAITFYLPFNLLGFLVLGLAARNVVARIPWPRRGEAPAAAG